jgi:putative endonuclease
MKLVANRRSRGDNLPMKSLELAGTALFERLLATLDLAANRLGRAPSQAAHLALGNRGEEAASFYLRRKGYVITARSWRSHRYAGDIDLIGWDGDCLCFIEVKTRTTREIATAESAVDESKRRTLRKIARHYLRNLPDPAGIRFDVVAIYFESEKPADFTLLKGVFGWSEQTGY